MGGRKALESAARIDIEPGQVIDLRKAQITGLPGRECLWILIRTQTRKDYITLYAPKENIDLLFGRITKIKKVVHGSRLVRGMMWAYTRVYVDLEDAFGEEPTYVAENSSLSLATGSGKEDPNAEWNRPEFTTGDVNYGKEKE